MLIRVKLAFFTLTVCAVLFGFSNGPVLAVENSEQLSITIPTVLPAPPIDGTLAAAAWQKAAKVTLGFDRLTHGAAAEPTTAYILTDGEALYVGFDATQTRTPVLTTQHSNNTGADADDEVKIGLWPGGSNGFNYQFVSTAIGTRYQISSENLSYEPTWEAAGHLSEHGYVVTMRIPLRVVRGANPKSWLVNFTRWEPTTGALYAWSGGPTFGGTSDTNYARPMIGMPSVAAARPKPRIGLYGLGAIAAPSAGGSTSRTGVDLSIPITQSSSFIATLHPDFSNAERDQQTIAPTATRRFFNETRPFFTQGANFYNYMECDACNGEQSLYTPSIPTPRDGYAVEGTEGRFTFGAFDAVGVARNDAAESVIFKTKPRNLFVSAQHVGVNMPGLRDNTEQFATKWDDLQHKFIYADYGVESGTLVTNGSRAHFAEIGGGFYGPNSFTGGGIRKIGAQYNPFDGFVSNTDIAGFGVFTQHTWTPLGSPFKQINANIMLDSYHGATRLNQYDINAQIDVTTRKLWEFVANTGSSYLLVGNTMTPVTQETLRLTYHSGTSTPTSLWYGTGRYGNGRLDTWYRSTTIKLTNRGSLSLEADDTRQYLDSGRTNIEWLQRASFAYQTDANSSFALGVRRFFGASPEPYGGGCGVVDAGGVFHRGYCPNVSFAYYRRMPHDELYVIYGDASATRTVPQFLVKFIHYFGAEKGT